MTCFLASLAMLFGGFGLGYFCGGHPEATRSFLTKARANISALFHKGPPK